MSRVRPGWPSWQDVQKKFGERRFVLGLFSIFGTLLAAFIMAWFTTFGDTYPLAADKAGKVLTIWLVGYSTFWAFMTIDFRYHVRKPKILGQVEVETKSPATKQVVERIQYVVLGIGASLFIQYMIITLGLTPQFAIELPVIFRFAVLQCSAVLEEWPFRFVLQPFFRWAMGGGTAAGHGAVWFQAFFFAGFHTIYSNEPLYLAAVFAGGLVMGYVLEITDNSDVTIGMHALQNFRVV